MKPLAKPGTPACAPLADLFTTDNPPDRDTHRQMAAVCGRCPVLTACTRQATTSPVQGFYAGRYYSERSRIRRTAA